MVRREFLHLGTLAAAAAAMSGCAAKGAGAADPIAEAEAVAGVEFTPAERDLMRADVAELLDAYKRMQAIALPNDVPPTLEFRVPPLENKPELGTFAEVAPATPRAAEEWLAEPEALMFAPLGILDELLASRRVTAAQLADLALRRLERFDPELHCLVTPLRERALAAAAAADAGARLSPLAGVPYGLKDLFAVAGAPTTWGAEPFRDQRFDADAQIVANLGAWGAAPAAKLSLGAIAMGDVWFGGMTRNPWKLDQGSSGSSAGSASAVAAGIFPFAIGTETLGSIVSPCTRCGVTGLRPTFGAVSRAGAMALSWSMDKVGPIARTAADCALVFHALRGDDPIASRTRFLPPIHPKSFRLGFAKSEFDAQQDPEAKANEAAALEVFRSAGFELVEVQMPDYPYDALTVILLAEAAAAFDELTRSGRDDELSRQTRDAWPNIFRYSRLIPAVEYIRADRIRTLLRRDFEALMAGVDALVAPSFGAALVATNLTGHPQLVMPNGFRADGTPTSITLTGRYHGEETLCALGNLFQQRMGHHLRRPPAFDPAKG